MDEEAMKEEMEAMKEEVWENVKGKTERFQEVITKCSVSEEYDDAIEEWEEIDSYRMYSGTCICSHRIINLFYIRHCITERVLIVGFCCIKKLGSEDMKNTMKIRTNIRNYKGNIQPCLNCGTHKKKDCVLFCKQCVSIGSTEVSRVMKEALGTRTCWGGPDNPSCGKVLFNGRPYEISIYCNDCDLLDCCGSCSCCLFGSDKPRCSECYRDKLPIKCFTPECWTIIPYSPATEWVKRCNECGRKCARVNCNKQLSLLFMDLFTEAMIISLTSEIRLPTYTSSGDL